MGVPRLFPFIKANFPKAITHFHGGEYTHTVDYLYLDANGLLHGAAQEVFHYGDSKLPFDLYGFLSIEDKRKKTFEIFFNRLIEVTRIIKPTKVLFIAIDGPAPLAKQNQQRERRYVASRLRLEKEKEIGKTKFDSNSITPGTIFMLELTRYINYAIRREMNTSYEWKNLNVYFSPPTVPGEGEHKCMNFIRAMSEKERISSSHCLFGPDADLIMLSLAAHIDKMFLFREDQYHTGEYDFVDIGQVRENLSGSLGQVLGVEKRKRDLNDVSNDFILEGFFVGNDFVPKIQMFHLLEEGLVFMSSTYAKTSSGGTKNFLTVDSQFNLDGFRPFVAELAKWEEKYLIEQVTTTDPKKQPPEPEYRNETLLKNISSKTAGTAIKYTLNFKGYQRDYYAKAGIDIDKEPKKVMDMCADYLRSFIWIIKYYIQGLPSWRWAYRHHYAPLMRDFNSYISSLTEKDVEGLSSFKLQKPSLPFEQLLSVLPPPSADLLPTAYRKLMLDPDSKLVQLGYYPNIFDFHIDYEGKLKEFQGVAILPFVDYKEIHQSYLHITECCVDDIDKYARNKKGKTRVYWYDKNYLASFTSDMGNIENLQIKYHKLQTQY
ncbi:MAG: hypothetical protein ACOCT9_02705 [archaeon]